MRRDREAIEDMASEIRDLRAPQAEWSSSSGV